MKFLISILDNKIVLFFLYKILKWVLKSINYLCCIEDNEIKILFKKYDFHPAIYAHPSILYKKYNSKGLKFLLSFKIAYLRKAIRIGLLKTIKGRGILNLLDIPQCYGNGLDFWFVEKYTPLTNYQIPNTVIEYTDIVVYTVLTGDYDNVNEILFREKNVDYILFTNNKKIKSKTWRVVYLDSKLDDVLLSREVKILPHKYLSNKYTVSIYIDANAVIYGELSHLLNFLQDDISFAVSKHSKRDNVRDEIEALVHIKGMPKDVLMVQYERYIKNGFKDDLGLAECGLLIRKHEDIELQRVMNEWWIEFNNGVRRDQISLLPVINKLQYKNWLYMEGNIWHNQFFKIISHKLHNK